MSALSVVAEITITLGKDAFGLERRVVRVGERTWFAWAGSEVCWIVDETPGTPFSLPRSHRGRRVFPTADGRVAICTATAVLLVDVEGGVVTVPLPPGTPRVIASVTAERLVLWDISGFGWVPLDGSSPTFIERDRSSAVSATHLSTARMDGETMLLTRTDGRTTDRAELPLPGPGHPEVPSVAAWEDNVVVVARDRAVVWPGDGPPRVVDAATGRAPVAGPNGCYIDGTFPTSRLTAHTWTGDLRWKAHWWPHSQLRAAGADFVSFNARDGKCGSVSLLDDRTGRSGPAFPLKRDLFLDEVHPLDDGSAVAVLSHVRESIHHAVLLRRADAAWKVPHRSVGGAVPWGPGGFATWDPLRENRTLALQIWR